MKNKLLNSIAVLLMFIMPQSMFSQAPGLGTLTSFAVFTAAGEFNNLGATNITGNIGTNVGALTGFPPGTIIGSTYVADGVTAQAAIDVNTAYSFLDGLTCGTVIGTTLGSGQVLTPGIYCMGGATTLNGNLIMDAVGDPDALFILQIDGALSTATFSTISLLNSASTCNIYWQVNGQFELGDFSAFKGTLIANGSLILLEGASLQGRCLSRSGAVSLNNNVIEVCEQASLPLTLVSFSADLNGSQTAVNLRWETASEINSAHFLIERSVDGILYNTIGNLDAAGFSSQTLLYSFEDAQPDSGINFYRLNQFDQNGMNEFSTVRTVYCNVSRLRVSIFPNPFTTSIQISIENQSQLNLKYELAIYNLLGEKVSETSIREQTTVLETINIPPGMYFYNLFLDGNENPSMNNTIVQSGKLISQ